MSQKNIFDFFQFKNLIVCFSVKHNIKKRNKTKNTITTFTEFTRCY